MLKASQTVLCACFLLIAASTVADAMVAKAAPKPADIAPQDLTGCGFTVRLIGQDHTRDGSTVLTFDAASVAGKLLGDARITYVVKRRKKSTDTTFEGTGSTSDGTAIEIEGAVDGKAIHGSVTRRPKDKPAEAVNFNGAMSAGTLKRKP